MSSTTFKSIPHMNAFDVLRKTHGVILGELDTARVSTAMQGIHAIAAILQQREIDTEMEPQEGRLTFGPSVAQGLIAALASCACLAEGIVDTGGIMGQRADYDSEAYQHLETARWRVLEANRKGASE